MVLIKIRLGTVHISTHTYECVHTHAGGGNIRDPVESKAGGKSSGSPCWIWMPHAHFWGPFPATPPLPPHSGISHLMKVESAGSLLSQGKGKWFRAGALCSKGLEEA